MIPLVLPLDFFRMLHNKRHQIVILSEAKNLYAVASRSLDRLGMTEMFTWMTEMFTWMTEMFIWMTENFSVKATDEELALMTPKISTKGVLK